MLKPMNEIQKWVLPMVFVYMRPHQFGQPEVDRRAHAENRTGHRHVVEVGNHKVGVVILEVNGRNGASGRRTADGEQDQETDTEQHRCLEGQSAAPHGGNPVEHFHTSGTAISMVAYIKNSSPATGIPTVNIWCAHTMNDRTRSEAVAYTMES